MDKLTAASTTSKAQRRQTAYYPLVNASNKPSKPFSRSAAKRESVLQLGSIEHLQHYFTKTGLKAATNPLEKKLNKNLVPALGPALAHLAPSALPTIVADFDLPPSPMIPPPRVQQPFAAFERTYEVDPEALKPGVLDDLAAVVRVWGLDASALPVASDDADAPTPTQRSLSPVPPSPSGPRPEFNVLNALKSTTRAIRSVRNYVLALPDEVVHKTSRPFRPGSLAHAPAPPPKKHAAKSGSGDALVRKAALDVLTILRELEESARIPGTDRQDLAEDERGSNFLGEGERSLTPSSMGSGHEERRASFGASVSGSSRSFSVPVWEDDEEEEEEDDSPKREHWDDRLILGGGWLYRTDIKLAELEKERNVIKRWLEVVDKIVFSDGKAVTRSPMPMAMTLTEEPEEEPEVQDHNLPNWARRHAFGDDFDERAHALLANLLPATLLPLLPLDGNRSELLAALSSGQLLCTAYNVAVRKSKKPWGYIDPDAIHDIANEAAEKEKKVWTFRRIENLRLFAAALKLRYLVPLVSPGQNAPPGPEPPIVFDARVVGKLEPGWEEVLERTVRRWVDAVVAEKRAEL
ncbi:hypothetical protein AURDEDRAFT_139582 [Auricularia subglabra TFB-10046 SS5]|nr:hypothetical protein AURDEDRAFT_139582 [Auricularia subglabra TFB-10046 SS5]